MVLAQLKLHKIPFLLLLTAAVFYWSFAYDLERTDFFKLLSLYAGLFFMSWKLFQLEKFNTGFLIGAAILFRLIFLFAIPNLSQDFYRFIWDGNLLLEGMNPYVFIPEQLISSESLFAGAERLYTGMGSLSAGNPTNYPPLNQLIFAIAALLGGTNLLGNIIVLHIFIILGDLGIFFFGRKLLKTLNLPKNCIFWYLLNPFIIIETTGNLHFEGVMIFFLLAAIYYLHQKKWFLSAILLSCSISIKLMPLMFLPLLFRKLGWKKALGYYAIVGILTLLFFLPFLSKMFLNNYWASISLWFQKFEFNASIFYLVRWIGYQVEGYNILIYAGPIMAFLVLLFVLFLSFFRRNKHTEGLILSMLFTITIYYFLSSTVHPWYLATPLILSIFTRFRFVLVWSFVVILSYFTYSNPDYEENLWLVALEYLIVFGYLGYELLLTRSVFAKEDAETSSA